MSQKDLPYVGFVDLDWRNSTVETSLIDIEGGGRMRFKKLRDRVQIYLNDLRSELSSKHQLGLDVDIHQITDIDTFLKFRVEILQWEHMFNDLKTNGHHSPYTAYNLKKKWNKIVMKYDIHDRDSLNYK